MDTQAGNDEKGPNRERSMSEDCADPAPANWVVQQFPAIHTRNAQINGMSEEHLYSGDPTQCVYEQFGIVTNSAFHDDYGACVQ